MNILMMTNTYLPHVGGVARSVDQFAAEYRRAGHRVLVVAPTFEGTSDDRDVVRVPSIEQFNGTSFSVPLPIPGLLDDQLDQFGPEIVHSHHPFLLGDTALRIAASRDLPVVFTHHTLYERYAYNVVAGSEALQRFVTELAAGYCNLCDAVIAPSQSIRNMLREHGVERRIEVIPTGVEIEQFATGDGGRLRRERGIPDEDFVVGHVGRLAAEKSIDFLAAAAAEFVASDERAWLLVAGSGPCEDEFRRQFAEHGVQERLILEGVVPKAQLSDVYHAMDVFAFASLSETQGMVLTEAMAAGVPVVAVDGPGVRDTVQDSTNGRLLRTQDTAEFVAALTEMERLSANEMRRFKIAARSTAHEFSMQRSAERALALYEELIVEAPRQHHNNLWSTAARRVAQEWKVWENFVDSAGVAVLQFDREPEPCS